MKKNKILKVILIIIIILHYEKMPIYQETEQIQAQTISSIIHPGSIYFYMRRASDLKPITLLHAMARTYLPNGIKYKDNFLPLYVILTSINKCNMGRGFYYQHCFFRRRN